MLVLQNEIPEAVNIAAATGARAAGANVILNAAPARAMSGELLGSVDILVVNRVEAEMLAGARFRDRDGAVAALPALGRAGRCHRDAGRRRPRGAGRRRRRRNGSRPSRSTVVSTHGAGDCFVGALAARLARGDDLRAAGFANAAAAAHVSR